MKKRLFSLVLGLLLTAPALASANGTVPDTQGQNQTTPSHEKHHHMKHGDWEVKQAERELMLLSWVNQYTPEKKAEWSKVLEEKKMLREKWMSPENAEKREQWKKQRMDKINELKKQVEAGKITKEELMKELHGDKGKAHFKTYHDLRIAVKNNDKKQAATLLNQLLEQSKEHNKMLSKMING